MASQQSAPKLHFILFPLMSPGDMIPLIDIANLLAQRDGVTVTVVSTPITATRFKPMFVRAKETGVDLRLVEFQVAYKEAGLPEGCENLDMLPSLAFAANFFAAMNNLQPQLENYLEEDVEPRPSCIISNHFVTCTIEVARKFGIPRIVFHGQSCFSLLSWHNILASRVLDRVTSDSEPFVVPGLPDQIVFTQAELSTSVNPNSKVREAFLARTIASEKEAYGIVLNSFEDLELEYVKEYKKSKTGKVYFVGPVSLSHKVHLDKAERGNKNSIDENQCMKWLDSWQPSSVVYACLGSLNNLKPSQMMELGFGLESSNKPFIWVIRENEDSKELKKLILEDGFDERIQGRGFLIWGWAPQVLILSHSAIGGFLTHCGWNSVLEGVSAGVPFITCPLFGDQNFNEKLVVQVLGIGVSIGGKGKECVLMMRKANVEKAVNRVMNGGEEGEERRKKTGELGKMAKRAMEEDGSSHNNIAQLIEDIMLQAHTIEST